MRGALGASDVRQWYLAVTNIAAVDAHPLGLAFGFYGLAPPIIIKSLLSHIMIYNGTW